MVRVGRDVLRPSNPSSRAIHRFLSALRDAGFEGSSRPVGIDADGRLDLVAGGPGFDPGGLAGAGRVLVLSGATGSLLRVAAGSAMW